MSLVYKLNRNDLAKLAHKYLSIAFGVLMIVVLSLNVEALITRRWHSKLFILRTNIDTACSECFSRSFLVLTLFNCEYIYHALFSCIYYLLFEISFFPAFGILLSFVLAIFCFLLGFHYVYYLRRQLVFSMVSGFDFDSDSFSNFTKYLLLLAIHNNIALLRRLLGRLTRRAAS